MKTTLEDISSIKKRLKVEVPSSVVDQARQKAINNVKKKATMPGFRQGKIPLKVVEERFGSEIQKQTVDHIIDQTLVEAFKEVNVRPVSRPEIDSGLTSASGGFSYNAVFEIFPEIELKEKDWKGMKLEKQEVNVTQEEIDQELKRLQHAMTQLEPLPESTKIAKGHVAIIDFKGLAEGKPFKGSQAKDFTVEVGAGGLLKDFEEGLKGAKAGDALQIKFTYPKDYFNKELANKKGEFEVKIKSVRKKNIPALNDDFAKDLGNFKSLAEVKTETKKKIAQSKETNQKNGLYNQIAKKLVENTKFDVPESLIQNEMQHMLNELAKDLQNQGQDIRKLDPNEMIKNMKPRAQFRVKSFLLIDKVAVLNQIQVSEQEIEHRLEMTAKGANRPLPEIKAYYEKNKLLGALQTKILHEKVLEKVLNDAKIKVVKPKKSKK